MGRNYYYIQFTSLSYSIISWYYHISPSIGRIGLSVSRQSVPTNSRKRPTWHPSVRTYFIRMGSVTTNRKNGLTGEQLAVGTDSRSVSTGASRMFSVLTEGCHVGYSREFVGTVYCTYGIRPLLVTPRGNERCLCNGDYFIEISLRSRIASATPRDHCDPDKAPSTGGLFVFFSYGRTVSSQKQSLIPEPRLMVSAEILTRINKGNREGTPVVQIRTDISNICIIWNILGL